MPVALVTGVTGQTGSYLAERLLADGWTVNGLVRDPDDARDELATRSPEVVLHGGDLQDAARIHELVARLEPDAVFNLGGISSVGYSWQHPEETARITGLGVVPLLDAAWALRERLGRPVAVVQASSAEMFGDPDRTPQDESTAIRPLNPYGAAKAFAHHLVGVYRARGLEASSCILYNHESPRRPAAFVTRKITRGAARIAAGLDDELALGNLDAVRDWGWAPDYADALARAGTASVAGDYVIASGEAHSVRDFVTAAFAAVGIDDWSGLVRQDPAFMRPVDAVSLVGDPGKAERELGWRRTRGFDQLVAAMVEHDVAQLAV